MQVLTLDETALESHAARLAKSVEEQTATIFDAIVGVRRGGSMVCDAFCRHFPRARYGERYDVTMQRPSTRCKGGIVSKMLRHLPTPTLNLMRMAESQMLELRHRESTPDSLPTVELPEGLNNILRGTPSPRILVIDDAIDSGDTLCAILNTLRKTNPETGIKTAVITQTTARPRIRADFSLYHNRTLIRFPWSEDYKKQRKG